MKNISARNKGLITGAIMILISIGIYLVKKDFDNSLQYIVYATYIAGILWTLIAFKKEAGDTSTFKTYFSEGFKCFIVVSFLMVFFTLVFILLHPELKEQMVAMMRADGVNRKDMTAVDIENGIAVAKKTFLPMRIMGAIFGYLLIGSVITLVSSFLFMRRK